MPVYNGEKYLRQAIESILSQIFRDFELIIVNDGSTDTTEDIVKSYQDTRIKYFKKENSGVIDSLNEGIAQSSGEYIARMDADDISAPTRFEEQIRFFAEHPNYVLVGSWAVRIDGDGNLLGDMNYPPTTWQSICRYSIIHNPFIHSSVMCKKTVFNSAGGYNKSFRHVEDYELWTRVIHKYPCANLPKRLMHYRVHNNQITHTKIGQIRLRGIVLRMICLKRFIFKS